MNINCYCGKGYELHYKQKKQLLQGFDAFCGGDCLYKILLDEGFKDTGIERLHWVYPSQMNEPFDYWCRETKQYFRSRSEATFARWCEANQIRWEYEPYMIRFKHNQTYTPDFWLPDFSHFIEVKGAWSGSAKKKMRKAKDMGFRLLLVPDHLIKKLSRVWRNHNGTR